MRSGITLLTGIVIIFLSSGIDQVRANWEENGIPVCDYPSQKYRPLMLSDDEGGFIIIWSDTRSDGGDIYAQRVGPYGDLKWDPDGVPVCTREGAQYGYHALRDESGGFFLTWSENQGFLQEKVYVQRINGEGQIMWGPSGREVSSLSRFQIRPHLVPDGADGFFIIWEDRRFDTALLFVQRFDEDGERPWQDNEVRISGTAISAGKFNFHPCDGCGATAVWVTSAGVEGWKICTQRVDLDGSLPWGVVKDVIVGTNSLVGFTSCWAPGGGNHIAWIDQDRFKIVHKVFGQKTGADGSTLWRETGVKVDSVHVACFQPRIIPSGQDGVIVLWSRLVKSAYEHYANRITADGAAVLGEHGTMVAYTATPQYNLDITDDGGGGVISVWNEDRDPGNSDIFAQRFDEYGLFAWTITGLGVCRWPGYQGSPDVLSDGRGGAFVAWLDSRSSCSVYATRIDRYGEPVPGISLVDYSAYLSGRDIIVEWTLDESSVGPRFYICRATLPDSTFTEIESPVIDQYGLSYTFRDRSAEPAITYRYRVDVSDEEERRILFTTGEVTAPDQPLTLYQNYPNPFASSTQFRYYIPSAGHVDIGIHDISGKLVATLFSGWKEEGYHIESWDGHDQVGSPVSPGLYMLRIESGNFSEGRKILLLR